MAAAMHMTAITLGEVCGELAGDYANLVITDLVADSRDVKPGAAFIALSGATAHGVSFALHGRLRDRWPRALERCGRALIECMM